jgi:outer membrane protein assembly factor BamB
MKQRNVLLLLFASLVISSILLESQLFHDVNAQTSATDWWPMFQHDPAHTGSSLSTVPQTNETLWIYDIDRIFSVGFAPSVVDGRLFIGTGRYFSCINSSTGVLLWQYTKDYLDPSTSPSVSNNKVIIGGGQYELYCFNIENGNMLWNFTAESWIRISPIIDNDRVFVGSDNGLYCLNLTNGELLWKYGERGCGSPTIMDNKLWVMCGEALVCVDVLSGDYLWESPFFNNVDAHSPVYYQGKILIGTGYGYNTIYCLNSNSGELLWEYRTQGGISATPAVVNDKVFVNNSGGIAGIYCLNITDGSLIWKRVYEEEYGSEYSSPVVADGKIILCLGKKLYVFNETDGEIVWSYDPPFIGSGVSTSNGFSGQNIALAEGKIYLASDEAKLFCFGPMIYYNLTIEPKYLNNKGNPFTPLPTSCTCEFSNETEKNASTPISFHAPLGAFSIKNVYWNGYEVLTERIPIYLDSDLIWKPNVNCTLPTITTLSLSSSTSSVGFKIDINGRLTCNEEGISSAPILLSYSVTDGDTWNELTQTYTSEIGEYSAIWMPTVSGHYVIKALWSGNRTFPKSSIQTYLAVSPVEEQSVISVASNSKVYNIIYNSSAKELSFNVTEPSESLGYSDVFIPKHIVGNVESTEVFLDGKKVDCNITLIKDRWLLHFEYIYGPHEVLVHFAEVSSIFDLLVEDAIPILLVLGVVVLCIIIVYLANRKR